MSETLRERMLELLSELRGSSSQSPHVVRAGKNHIVVKGMHEKLRHDFVSSGTHSTPPVPQAQAEDLVAA